MAGLLTSSTALTIFETDAPGHLDIANLRKGAFTGAIDPDGIKSGWVGLGNLLDTENFFLAANDSRFSGFSFRLDVRKPSAAVIRLQLAEKIRQEEAEGKKVGGKRKKELREEVVERLTAHAEFVPALTDCLWDAEKGMFMICSTSEKIIDRILKHFQACFGKVAAPLATDEDTGAIFGTIQRKNGIAVSGYSVQPMGTANLHTQDASAESSSISVRNNPEAVNEALNQGFTINRIALVATDKNNEENQINFTLDALLQLNTLRFPKPDREDGEDGTFLINAQICADTVQIVSEITSAEQQA